MSGNPSKPDAQLSFPTDSGIIQPGGNASGYQPYGVPTTFDSFLHMVEIHFKTGARLCLAYHWLTKVEFDPSLCLTLTFQDVAVTIKGRNLGRLATLVSQHQVVWIREADRPTAALVYETEPLVEEVQTHPIRLPTTAG